MLCVVRKEFDGPQGPIARGTKLDSEDFRLGRQLIEQRYLEPVLASGKTGSEERDSKHSRRKKNAETN
jgi:hypothetical protein